MTGRVLAAETVPGNVVLDLDGCLYVDSQPIPGVGQALGDLSRAGFRLIFATNNSTRTAQAVAARVTDITGHPVAAGDVVTSAIAATRMLRTEDAPVLAIGEAGLAATITQGGIGLTDRPDEARAVIVGLDRSISYERIRIAARAVLLGARFIGTNPDVTFPTASLPVPGAGTIVAAVAAASGTEPEFAGKPYHPMRRAVAELLGEGPTWVVGDRAETDIALGRAAGWSTALVLTGIVTDASAIPPEFAPDHVLSTVAELPSLLGLEAAQSEG